MKLNERMFRLQIVFAMVLIVAFTACTDRGVDTAQDPEVTSVTPTEGPVGTAVTITGSGFSTSVEGNSVSFNGTEAVVSTATESEIKTNVPAGATSGPISVRVNGNNADGPTFTVIEEMPGIESVEPDSGVVGTEIVITGMNFSATASENIITFNGVAATVSSATETELVTTVPAGATDGPLEVSVNGETASYSAFDVITTGALRAFITTTGSEQDSNGYTLTVDETDLLAEINDTLFIGGLEQGSYDIELSGMASNCAVSEDNPRNISIASGDTTETVYAIACEGSYTIPEIIPETITAGSNHGCGLDVNGNAYCWGRNASGQIGDGTTDQRDAPVAVSMPFGVSFSEISAAGSHTVAIGADGSAWAWGYNLRGQLGDGTENSRNTPTRVVMPLGVSFTSISAGLEHTVALASDSTAYAWGSNYLGSLGNGTNIISSNTPVAVVMPSDLKFIQISAGRLHTTALSEGGEVWTWGRDGTTSVRRDTPVLVNMPNGTRQTKVSAGNGYTLAVDTDGNAWAWGENGQGQLGDGTKNKRSNPVQVNMPAGVSFANIDAGYSLSLALDDNGQAYAWGSGALGDGDMTDQKLSPYPIAMPTGVSFEKSTIGPGFLLALDTNGQAWAWGSNNNGQLGDGTTTNRPSPVQVQLPSGVTFK